MKKEKERKKKKEKKRKGKENTIISKLKSEKARLQFD